MKKIISILLAVIMLFTVSSGAVAETAYTINPDTTQASTEISFANNGDGTHGIDSFVVTIPMSVSISKADESISLPVLASDVYILAGKRLLITAASENGFSLVNGASSIPYTCKLNESQITSDTEILSVNGAGLLTGKQDSVDLKLSATTAAINGAASSGAHTDRLTFTCIIVKATETEN